MGLERRPGELNFDRDGTLYFREFMLKELREASRPLLVFEETTIPAASLWTGSKLWIDELSRAGMQPGDRIVLSLPPGPAFVEILLAAFWDKYTLVPLPPDGDRDPGDVAELLDARLTVGCGPGVCHSMDPGGHGPGGSLELIDYGGEVKRTEEIRVLHPAADTDQFLGFTTENLLSQTQWFSPVDSTISLDSWYRADSLVANLLHPLLDKQRLVVPARKFGPGSNTDVPRFDPDRLVTSVEGPGDDKTTLLRNIDGTVRELLVRTEPDTIMGERTGSLLDDWSGEAHYWTSLGKSCGPLAYVSHGSSEVLRTGLKCWTGSRGNPRVFTRGAAGAKFDPGRRKFEMLSVPRWVETGVADPNGPSELVANR